MKYLYKLFTNAIKRLVAFILSLIAGLTVTMIFMMPVIYFVVWLSTFFYDQKPPLSEAWYLWLLTAIIMLVSNNLSDRYQEYLLRRFGIHGDAEHE